MSKRSRLPLALALALGSSPAWSLGLGQIEVKSALNQPLSAEIPVLSTQSGEADALVVRLAPPEALTRVGLPAPSGVAANLQFTVDTNSRGDTVIRVTTPGKVSDPFVTFLIEVDWGQGKILREYTLLLDPPTMAPVRSAPRATAPVSVAPVVEAPVEVPPPPAMPEPAREPEPAATFEPVVEPVVEPEPAAAPPPPEPVAEPPPRPASEVLPPADPDMPRARTDTYGPVASGETLWSIAQYARPDDTVSMNQMMLALLYANPDAFIDQNINRLKRGAVLRIPTREEAQAIAAAEAAAQVRDQMQAWNQRAAPVVQPAEPEPTETPASRPVAGRPPSQDSRLELVPPRADESASGAQSGASVAGEGRELRAELARAREQVSTLSQENVELKSRVGELERIQGDSERLIALKDSELAAAQQRLAELEARQAEAAAVPDEPTTAVADANGAPALDPDAVATNDPAAETQTETPTGPAAEPVADAGTAEIAPVVAPPPADTAPVADAATAPPLPERPAPTPWYMSPWVLGGGLLVVVGLLALLLGRRKAPAATPASRYATPASVLAASESRDEDDEAADEDEAAVLAEAVARDPANLARHLELVRHYYDAGDAAGFEHAAEAMYARVYDPDDLAWKQVLAMGREIAPEHPLFVEHGAFESPQAAEPLRSQEPPAREIDWGATPAASGATQQMRIDDVRADYSTQAQPVLDVPQIEPSVEIESFSYEPVAADAASAPVADDAAYVDADAASTKLELARAYLDMGDVEGARGMLEEVVSEGNPGQRAEAKRLLDEIR
jgi:pilus assembly protein FimV